MANLKQISLGGTSMDVPAGGGGSGAIADLFEIVQNEPFDIGTSDIITEQNVIDALNLNAMTVGTSNVKYKTPTVAVNSYTWSSPDVDAIEYTTAAVTLTFADGSTLSDVVQFKRHANAQIYAAKPADNSGAYIDTGLTLNYSYTFSATGHTTDSGQSVLIGALTSTSSRTTGRILGGSNKFAHAWPGLTDYTNATTGIDFRKMFSYTHNGAIFIAAQGDVGYADYPTKTTTGTDTAPILLFNETPTADFNRGTIAEAIIQTSNTTKLRHFNFYHLNGEIVAIDKATIGDAGVADIMQNGDASQYASHIYRPVQGSLVQVYQAEDAA